VCAGWKVLECTAGQYWSDENLGSLEILQLIVSYTECYERFCFYKASGSHKGRTLCQLVHVPLFGGLPSRPHGGDEPGGP